MLIEAKLAARTEHPGKLGERLALVWYRAQHSTGDDDIDRIGLEPERGGDARHDLDGDRSVDRGRRSLGAQIRLRLDSDQLRDAVGVVLEVDAVAGPDLHHPSPHAGQELSAQLLLSVPTIASAEPVKEAGEHGV